MLVSTALTGFAGEFNNLSSRGYVANGQKVLIGGMIINGSDARVVIRALGPSLRQFGLDALPNPALFLHDGNGQLLDVQYSYYENTPEDLRVLENRGLTPQNANECAMVKTLPVGTYTAIIRGQNKSTGIALVEFYKLN